MVAALLGASACEPPPPEQWGPYAEIVFEEDARGARGLERVLVHLESEDPDVRRFAVRALGRLEDPALLDRIVPMLEDPDDWVREEAATAVAQAVFRRGAPTARAEREDDLHVLRGVAAILRDRATAADALAARAGREDAPHVLGAIAANLGRLRAVAETERAVVAEALAATAGGDFAPSAWAAAFVPEDADRIGHLAVVRTSADRIRLFAEHALAGIAALLSAVENDVGLAARLGLARGAEALTRTAPEHPLEAPLLEAVDGLRGLRVAGDARTAARVRRLATTVVAREAERWAGADAKAWAGRGGGSAPTLGRAVDELPNREADEADRRRHADVIGAFADGGALTALGDEDWGVRRAVALAAAASGLGGREVVTAALADADPRVRVEALRAHDRWVRPAAGCAAIFEGLADADPRVAAVAVDLAAAPCPEPAAQTEALAALAARLDRRRPGGGPRDPERDGWQLPARALASLAAVAPGAAAPAIAANRSHPSPFARAWVARAAARAGDAETLLALSADADPNVREAAARGLGAVSGARALDVYARQLQADDAQLVMTAVALLAEHGALDAPPAAGLRSTASPPDSGASPPGNSPAGDVPRAAPPGSGIAAESSPAVQPPPSAESLLSELLAALARFTALERETLRDARTALLGGVERLGGYAAADVDPYLADFDSVVARRAADLIAELGEVRPAPAPAPFPLAPPPSAERLRELARSSVRLRMEGLGDVVIALRPDLAATNADRFARLARSGYFDGLTFHRVVPNFVVQGGSPHANEYAGDGPYSRDEISGQPHWRGTVGLSTRGRDTGDAQIFVNLVDNVRLDFNYTILGEVVEGMDVVDRMQEGAVIAEARLERR